jgi:hypothetical protein
MSSLHLYQTKNDRANFKHRGRGVTVIASTSCRPDCDCAQRLVRCQKAASVDQNRTIFV